MGDHSDGLSTTELPRARGAAMARAERINAAFHGEMAPTTPTGRRSPMANAPWSEGMTSPTGVYARAAACRKSPGTKPIWNMPKPNVHPVSRASSETTSSERLSRISAAFRKTRWRAAGGDCDQALDASCAPATARAASSRPAAETVATTSLVKGSRSSKLRPPFASIPEPSMNSWK